MPELQQLENQGWEQMLQMLNHHLPQEAPHPVKVRSIRPLFLLAAAACVGVLFCMPVLLTDSKQPVLREVAFTDGPSSHPLPNPAKTDSRTLHFVPVMAPGTQAMVLHNRNSISATPDIPVYTHTAGNMDTANTIGDTWAATETAVEMNGKALPSTEPVNVTVNEKIPERLPLIFFPEAATGTPAQLALQNKQSLLSLAVQLNHNLNSMYNNTGNVLYNMPAYPSVTASVHVTKNISFSTGISVLAPGSLNGRVQSEASTPISNGNAASTMAVVDKDVVRQAYYMQIPVTMDVSVRRNLAVSSGAGFAFMQKALVQREARTTDANNNEFVTRTVHAGTSAVLMDKKEIAETPAGKLYNIRSSERRFLLNVQYQLKNFNLGLQYSRALSPSVEFPDHPERNIRNQTITISVGMPLFRR